MFIIIFTSSDFSEFFLLDLDSYIPCFDMFFFNALFL